MRGALLIRCGKCRNVLAVLREPGARPYRWRRFRGWDIEVTDAAGRSGVVRFGRCERCYLWRGDFVRRVDRVREGDHVRIMHEVPWGELWADYLTARASRHAVEVCVTDDGRITR